MEPIPAYSYSYSLPMPPSSPLPFDHEKLVAYQRRIPFVAWASNLLECAACLDGLVAKGQRTADQIQSGKGILSETVCLVVGLIKSLAPDRLHEEQAAYGSPAAMGRTGGQEE